MKIGFSTGALAKGDVRRGLEMQRAHASGAVELSALREAELPRLLELLDDLDLSGFDTVSVHAPSRLETSSEQELCDLLMELPREWPIIIHPNVISEPPVWRSLGSRVTIENMDRRKELGRTAAELSPLMEALPEARFCLDLAHAEQIDPTMREATKMIDRFGERLVQLHVSRLGPSCEHLPLDADMISKIERVARSIPRDVPIIIESVVEAAELEAEIGRVRKAFGI